MDARPYKVLLIEDNLADVERINQHLSRATSYCFQMEWADRLATGIQCFSQQDIDAVLLNLRLPDSEGLETLRAVQASAPHSPLIVLSLAGDKPLALQALEEGADDYLIKATFDADSLERSLRYAIRHREAVAVSRERETGMRLFLQQLPAVLWSTDTELRFTSITGAGMKRLTSNPDDLVGQTLFEFFGTRDPAFHPISQHRRALEGEPVKYDIEWAGRSFTAHIEPLRDEKKNIVGCIGVAQDITKHKRAEKQFRDLLESAPDAMVIVDRMGQIVLINAQAERLFAYPREELIGQPVEVLIPERFRQRHCVYRSKYFENPHPRPMANIELYGRRKGGTEFAVEISLNMLETSEGILASSTIRDITAQKQLQQQIVELAETERLRMGRELHDTFGQQMSAIAMFASSLRQQLEVEGSPLADKAVKLDQRIREAQNHVRTLAHGQLPVEVDANGLTVALEELASNTCQLHDVECTFARGPAVPVENIATATHLYRIAQEAVYNAVKHGRARQIQIRVQDEDQITLSVHDNGAGIAAGGPAPGAGLRIMRYRAGLIRATLRVESELGKGTMVTCTLPKDSRYARSVTKE